ncbi:MAG TPA: signal peptidase I [bacterium]|nr:signal peptidase I [bacterium]
MKEGKTELKRKHISVPKLIKTSLIVWLVCIFGVFTIIGYVVGIRHELFDKTPNVFVYCMCGLVLIGGIAFIIGIITLATHLLSKSKFRQNNFIYIFKLFFVLIIFPLYLLVRILKPILFIKNILHSGIKGLFKSFRPKYFLSKLGALVAVVFVLLPIWASGYAMVWIIGNEILGYNAELISITGTGSMYPTFPKGKGADPKELYKQVVDTPGMIPYPNGLMIAGRRYFNYELGRRDIVVIENDKIREMSTATYGVPSGWVKRLVGLPKDSIELRGGIVYLNEEPLKEPYVSRPRSTFGETFLSECVKVIVPEDSIFVMGDNRKGSGDSREIGFIEISAVDHVLPLKKQVGTLDKNWRDTTNDFEESSKIKLDKEKYVQLLNEKRKEVGASEIKYQPKLEDSATKRAEKILEFNDFSFEAVESGYTMANAMRDSNYSNIVYGEAPTQGYYEAEELIDNQFQFPESKKFLTDKRYQEIGISEVEGEINGCPTQVIVQHFAGYVPPNYEQSVVNSWKDSLSRLKEIQPGWAKLKEYSNFYKDHKSDVNRINEIIKTRIANISSIISRMEANQWLTDIEENMIKQDTNLYNEMESIAKRINDE